MVCELQANLLERLILPRPGEFVVVDRVYCWLWCSVWRFYVNRVHTAIAIKASLPSMANKVTENQIWKTTVIESIHHVWTLTKTVIKIIDMKKILRLSLNKASKCKCKSSAIMAVFHFPVPNFIFCLLFILNFILSAKHWILYSSSKQSFVNWVNYKADRIYGWSTSVVQKFSVCGSQGLQDAI